MEAAGRDAAILTTRTREHLLQTARTQDHLHSRLNVS